MTLGYQARAMLAGLAKLGEPSSLEGTPCGFVSIERDVVEFAGIGNTADDNSVVRYTVLSIASSFDPKVGQNVVHPDGSYRLDRLISDNRFVRRFIVV